MARTMRRSRAAEEEPEDDYEDERPRGRRSRDEEDRPRGRSRRSRDEDYDEEEEAERPRRSRRSRDEEEDDYEEDRPRGRSRRSRSEEDDYEDERPRGRRSRDDEEDDRPRARRGQRDGGRGKPAFKRGWGEGRKVLDANSSFAQTFKPGPDTQIVKFLEDEPYASYGRHWVERRTREGTSNRPYTCLESIDKECPLCEINERVQPISAFNVAVVDDDGDVALKSWDAGPQIFRELEKYANDPKFSPLSKGYFAVFKPTGKNTKVSINPIPSDRSLEEDYDSTAPHPDDLDDLKLYTENDVEIPSVRDVREVAEEIYDY